MGGLQLEGSCVLQRGVFQRLSSAVQQRNLRLGLVDRDARLQTRHQRPALAAAQPDPRSKPYPQPREFARRHPDDRRRDVPDIDPLADYPWVEIEPVFPVGPAQDRDRGRSETGAVVLRANQSPRRRPHAKDRKVSPAYGFAVDRLDDAALAAHGKTVGRRRDQAREHVIVVANGSICLRREGVQARVARILIQQLH